MLYSHIEFPFTVLRIINFHFFLLVSRGKEEGEKKQRKEKKIENNCVTGDEMSYV